MFTKMSYKKCRFQQMSAKCLAGLENAGNLRKNRPKLAQACATSRVALPMIGSVADSAENPAGWGVSIFSAFDWAMQTSCAPVVMVAANSSRLVRPVFRVLTEGIFAFSGLAPTRICDDIGAADVPACTL